MESGCCTEWRCTKCGSQLGAWCFFTRYGICVLSNGILLYQCYMLVWPTDVHHKAESVSPECIMWLVSTVPCYGALDAGGYSHDSQMWEHFSPWAHFSPTQIFMCFLYCEYILHMQSVYCRKKGHRYTSKGVLPWQIVCSFSTPEALVRAQLEIGV